MRLPRWLPHPWSFASAGALLIFAMGVSFGMAFALPPLFELMHTSPRLAWAGILAVWCSPVVAAAFGHHVLHAVLDVADTKKVARGAWPGASSVWAGFLAWATIPFVTLTTGLFMLMVNPPPVEPGSMWTLAAGVLGGSPGLRTVVWVILAAYVYELERRTKAAATDA